MSKYAGTKTEKNLMEAFAGESMARNKYTYFASVAKKAGWVCKICGYVHESETLPEDFVCPLCRHGVEDFEYFEQ